MNAYHVLYCSGKEAKNKQSYPNDNQQKPPHLVKWQFATGDGRTLKSYQALGKGNSKEPEFRPLE